MSSYVAAYFAVKDRDTEDDAEIWGFDRPGFERDAQEKQWKKWPETTIDGSGKGPKFRAELTAFTVEEPPNWFICAFYPLGLPRQNAQQGAYTMTARFGRDHAEAIREFFNETRCHHLYVVSKGIKPALREFLREKYGISRGSLFPDSAGAAATAGRIFRSDGK
jgi:hypothetical protein